MTEFKCPECGHTYEVEESQQAQEKQAEALKQQKEKAKAETLRLLAEQKEKLAKDNASKVEAEIQKQVKIKQAEVLKELEKETQAETKRLLSEQKEKLEKDRASKVAAEVNKQVKAKEAEVLQDLKKNMEQEAKEARNKVRDLEREKLKAAKAEWETEKDRLTTQVQALETGLSSQQNVELKGEAAEARLKAELETRFPEDRIEDIKKGAEGADLELHINFNEREIAMMLIERKSTKTFQKPWIPKLKKDLEKSKGEIGVIVTDVMPKDKEDSKLWQVSSNVYVVKADAAVDILDVLRRSVISNFMVKEALTVSEDEKVTSNVFKFLSSTGKEYLEEFSNNIFEKEVQLNQREGDHKKQMKKEWKNLEDQKEVLLKF
ncbi:uncharacterized protein METZ01_LOCUS148953, partial [marine metagenome]